jgi:hypothetical protein
MHPGNQDAHYCRDILTNVFVARVSKIWINPKDSAGDVHICRQLYFSDLFQFRIIARESQAWLFSDTSENREQGSKSYFRVHLEGPDRKRREMHYSSVFGAVYI